MRKSSVLENASATGVRFTELNGDGGPKGKGRQTERSRLLAGQETRLRTEWAEKVNKALEQGLAQGEARAAEKLAGIVQALDKTRRDVADFRARIEVDAEKHAVELATKLAQTVIRTQVAFDEAVLASALSEAVRRVPVDSLLRVRVNPSDLAAAQSTHAASVPGDVEIVGDEAVGRGGCVLETKLGEINSTVEERWQAAEELLREASPGGRQDVQ